jgi:hypothetical protein
MKRSKLITTLAMGIGLLAPGAATLSAQDWGHGYGNGYGYRHDLDRDYGRVDRMRADIAHDRARLNEDIRCGRQEAAARDAADLARDQRALDAQWRDIRHDRYWR